MLTRTLQQPAWWFAGIVLACVVCIIAAFSTGFYPIAVLPVAVALAAATIYNFRWLYFLLTASIPLSVEFYFSSSLATDLPDEPIMIVLMVITLVFIFQHQSNFNFRTWLHPIALMLGIHYLWIFLSAITSVNPLVSFKVFLAKTWYITTFFILTIITVSRPRYLRLLFWCVFVPVTFTIVQTLLRHGLLYNFYFEDVNKCVYPFYRNHVNYAACVSVVYPLIWMAAGWYDKNSLTRAFLNFMKVFYIVAIWFSFTRTCMLAVLLIPFVVMMIRWRVTKVVLLAVAVAGTAFITYLAVDNRYLSYAPDYRTTIYHDEFSDHMSATLAGKDVSSMERIYRWIAAVRMFSERPMTGFGAGNFYPYYKQYTVSSFETWVSENPERSTVHNYFLLLLCEQGVIGLFIFLMLTAVIFIWAEKIYHRSEAEVKRKTVLWLTVGVAMVYVNILLSDMLESDKVGPFFFVYLALLVAVGTGHFAFDEKPTESGASAR